MSDACIYTVLIGNYESLLNPFLTCPTGLRKICFTDDESLESSDWEIRLVKPLFPADPIRSQRAIKICPHKFLPDFARSIYIDNGIFLKSSPESLLDRYSHCDLVVSAHSFRETLLDEFIEVSRLGLDDQSRIFEQLNHYELFDSVLLRQKPYWTAILIRNHLKQNVRDFSDRWLCHVMRYSRRDQLSINWALHASELSPEVVYIDNHESSLHEWKPGARNRNDCLRDPRSGMMPLVARRREAELFTNNAPQASSNATQSLLLASKSERHQALGDLRFSRLDAQGQAKNYARDYAVATEITAAKEVGERWFSIIDNGEMKTALVLARPNIELETSVFVRWRHQEQECLGRILLEPDDSGFATLKIKLSP